MAVHTAGRCLAGGAPLPAPVHPHGMAAPRRRPAPPHQPGEAVVLYLDMTTTVVLTPGCCEDNGHFTTSVAVETSLPVEFRTSDRADRRGGLALHREASARG
jgi:hypothetical protein